MVLHNVILADLAGKSNRTFGALRVDITLLLRPPGRAGFGLAGAAAQKSDGRAVLRGSAKG
jgi:hypothetical protein